MHGMDGRMEEVVGSSELAKMQLGAEQVCRLLLHFCIMPWCDNPIASQLSSARLVVCHVWQVRRLEEQPAETLNRCGSAACHGELWAMSQTPRHDISLQALNSEPGQLDGVARLILRSKAQFFELMVTRIESCWVYSAALLQALQHVGDMLQPSRGNLTHG